MGVAIVTKSCFIVHMNVIVMLHFFQNFRCLSTVLSDWKVKMVCYSEAVATQNGSIGRHSRDVVKWKVRPLSRYQAGTTNTFARGSSNLGGMCVEGTTDIWLKEGATKNDLCGKHDRDVVVLRHDQ